jgi:hypothetical protein
MLSTTAGKFQDQAYKQQAASCLLGNIIFAVALIDFRE